MKFKLYSIIILICLALLICLFFINKEGFVGDYNDYNSIDRIKISPNEHAYCIAGNISCPNDTNDTPNKIDDNYDGGKTYDFLCSNDTYAECVGSFAHNAHDNQYLNQYLT